MRGYHIAADSCTDPAPGMASDRRISFVPLTLRAGSREFRDDASFDQASFLEAVRESGGDVSSSCPPPGAFMDAFGDDEDDAYGITLSSRLSGSYNSALIGAEMVREEHPDKNVHVFDSKSAACAQTLVLRKLQECLEAGMGFVETVERVERYIAGQTTLFVLDRLDALKRNGRLNKVEGLMATALNLKPVLGDDGNGEIRKLSVGRGMRQALDKLAEQAGKNLDDAASRVLAITHCNCLDRARDLAGRLMDRYGFKDCMILEARGVSSMYAADGGVVVAY